ncbi:MAG TPA: SprT family zinc-dependent metalloprotease [Burkholderiaceae bacterium]|jgi:hypothetical protein|nr:SprT family zinc-dependent metalloprotease [Burkholderiaceae bacterium]
MVRAAVAGDPLQMSLFDGALPVEPARGSTLRSGEPGLGSEHPPAPEVLAPRDGLGKPRSEIVPAPAVHFAHPHGEREVRLGEHRVGYVLKRVRRRSIGFLVGAEGLAVNAPRWVSLQNIEEALVSKGPWILRKLQEQRERAHRVEAARIEWRDGAGVPFLGETVIVVLDPRVAGAVLDAGATALPGVPRLTLHVGLPHTATAEQIRDTVQSWLQRQALRVFGERCAHYAPSLGVHMRRLSLSAAQTRWGSASADGSIRLNWRLVHFGLPVIDYVVAHELAHLREMNHSAAFWDVVRSVVPDYERLRTTLKEVPIPVE